MDDIHYDILDNIISNLNLDDTINFLYSSVKIYNLYNNFDENYGRDKIANKIIKESLLFFNLKEIDNVNKHKLCNILVSLYNVYKNNKNFNNIDVLIYMIENNIDSDELFDRFCSKCKYVTIIKNVKDRNNFITVLDYACGKKLYYKEYTKNIISKSDMNYMLIYADNKKIDILLKHFYIDMNEITHCIKMLLKSRISNYNQKIEKYIDYIFIKYCLKDMTSYNKSYFNIIYTDLCIINEASLLNYLLFKIHKYKCNEIFNNNLNIMLNNLNINHK